MTRVFILCTGRCGSTTFAKAAAHATNFTAKHESRSWMLGPARLAYPDNHIEIDNRLSWWLGRLDQRFGDSPHFVHLLRDPGEVARSYAGRQHYGLMKAYRESLLLNLILRPPFPAMADIAADMVETITANITHFLRDKSRVMTIGLETIATDFPRFWNWIGAKGDLAAAMAEWQLRHNATKPN